MQKKITIIDSTLRDGSHALAHQLSREFIEGYAQGAELAGMPFLVVGHGNGLGASSVHLGQSLLTDHEMLSVAKSKLSRTKLAGFLIPGFGTIKRDIIPAIEAGIQCLIVASHCTEANVTRQHIQFGRSHNLETYGVLMMSHMATSEQLLENAKAMESYGAEGIILMDSAGAYLPVDVQHKIATLVRGLHVAVGFHAHNNLGMAVANSLIAVESGATIIDATTRGLGAGAGNCPLEAFSAVLSRSGTETGLNLYSLMDNGDLVAAYASKLPEINSITLTSGLSGVFSGFAPHASKAAKRFGVDVRDILSELGRRSIVAGQEDMIIEVAKMLSQQKRNKPSDFQLETLT